MNSSCNSVYRMNLHLCLNVCVSRIVMNECFYFFAKVIFIAFVGVILKPCRASFAVPAWISFSNSTKAMSDFPGTSRTSRKPGNLRIIEKQTMKHEYTSFRFQKNINKKKILIFTSTLHWWNNFVCNIVGNDNLYTYVMSTWYNYLNILLKLLNKLLWNNVSIKDVDSNIKTIYSSQKY